MWEGKKQAELQGCPHPQAVRVILSVILFGHLPSEQALHGLETRQP